MAFLQIGNKKQRAEKERIRRIVEKGDHEEGMSPWDPPDVYAPPGEDQGVPYEEMHPVLQAFCDDHRQSSNELDLLEAALASAKATDPNDGMERNRTITELSAAARRFYEHMTTQIVPHTRREEKFLFPLLGQRLRESGEHSNGPTAITAVDVLEGEHLDHLQLAAVAFNFLELALHLQDFEAETFVRKTAMEQIKSLIEQLRLHMFREDTVYFALAQKLLTKDELDQVGFGGSMEPVL